MKIVAIDFETANSSMASACSLGIAVYQDGELLDHFEWYIKPHPRYFYFTNTYIHGITAEDVINEKEFVFYYDQLAEIFRDSLLVAHNALFDITVLNSVCDLYGLNHFPNPYLDTVYISRRIYPELFDHKLNTVSAYLEIDLSHHNAASDSFACLMILLKAMQACGCYEVEDFMEYLHIQPKYNM